MLQVLQKKQQYNKNLNTKKNDIALGWREIAKSFFGNYLPKNLPPTLSLNHSSQKKRKVSLLYIPIQNNPPYSLNT